MFRRLSAVLLAAGVAGCGTTLNMREGPGTVEHCSVELPPKCIYGGVRLAALQGAECAAGVFTDRTLAVDERALAFGAMFVHFIDVPVSLVADTYTLQATIEASLKRRREDAAESSCLRSRTPTAGDAGR